MKKIMFNDRCGLTQAVLDGRKTVTRRLMNPQLKVLPKRDEKMIVEEININPSMLRGDIKPQYKVGEIVAIAQSYKDIGLEHLKDESGYNNKMFVKAELMPNQIKITSIRAERVQEITDDDCLREGIFKEFNCVDGDDFSTYCNGYYSFESAKESFASLIDKTCGKGTWESNPFMWVYEFELIK